MHGLQTIAICFGTVFLALTILTAAYILGTRDIGHYGHEAPILPITDEEDACDSPSSRD